MHGLINRSIEGFICDTRGRETWAAIAVEAELGFDGFEAMLSYDDALTEQVLAAAERHLGLTREVLLEDVGTYLVSNENTEAVRRLLRFGGTSFVEFLHSLDDLPGRARLAVGDLHLPALELREHAIDQFSLTITSEEPGFGAVLMGILRAMADDYGALVLLEHIAGRQGVERIDIRLIEVAFAAGRSFDLGVRTK